MRRKCTSWWMTDVSWHFLVIFSHSLRGSNSGRFLRLLAHQKHKSSLGIPNDRFFVDRGQDVFEIWIRPEQSICKDQSNYFPFLLNILLFTFFQPRWIPPQGTEKIISSAQIPKKKKKKTTSLLVIESNWSISSGFEFNERTFHFRTKIFISIGEKLLSNLLGRLRLGFRIRRRRCHHRSIRQYQRILLIYVTNIQEDWISLCQRKINYNRLKKNDNNNIYLNSWK